MKMKERSDWASYGMREAFFWRNGMTPEEYEEENAYLWEHLEDLLNGTYAPLWKQKLQLKK